MLHYSITYNDLRIGNSYLVRKRDFKPTLERIRLYHPDSFVWRRSLFQMQMEWAACNALYALGLWRARTKDCHITTWHPFRVRAFRFAAGLLAWAFIK